MNGGILLVDDGSRESRELRHLLTELEIGAVVAVSGPHALRLAETQPPNLVVTDLFIPGLDGLSLARRLERRGIETLLLSSTAPAFAPGAAPKAQVILRDGAWRPALMQRLLPHAGKLSASKMSQLEAWSQGGALDAKVSFVAPAPDEAPAPRASPLSVSPRTTVSRALALESASEIGDLLLAGLREFSPEECEVILDPLLDDTRAEVRAASFQACAALGAISDRDAFITRAEENGLLFYVLVGACTRRTNGVSLLEAIADRPGAETRLRRQALEAWARGVPSAAAEPTLMRWLRDPALAPAALDQLVRRGANVLVEILSNAEFSEAIMAAGLLRLGLRAPRPSFDEALELALKAASPLVRAAGYEIGMTRLGAQADSLLTRLATDPAPSSAFAALAGAMDLGEAGYGVLTALNSSNLPPEVRSALQLALHRNFGEGPVPDEDHDHLIADLKEELVPTRPEAPADFVGPENIDADFYRGPTEPRRPATVEVPKVRSAPKKRAKSLRAHPAEEPGPSPRELRAKLDAAEAMGRDGFKVVVEIARERRAPPDLRARAVRHLGTELFGPEAVGVLDKLLLDEAPTVQNAALGVFMNADTQWLDRFLAVATSEIVTAKVRARAVKHIGARFSRDETTEALEALFEDASALVRRAALEGLFPTLRNLQGAALDEGLMNLMGHHASNRARVSAARALGVFGSEGVLSTLDGLIASLFQAPEVAEAARQAAARLKAR